MQPIWPLAPTSSAALTQNDFRLDKNIFKTGLDKLQMRVNERFYTTTLDFARDLCDVLREGINAEPDSTLVSRKPEQTPNAVNGNVSKQTYNEPRDRKRLGKRILKAVQPQLDMALEAEATVTSKPLATLAKEINSMLEACVELQQPSITVSGATLDDMDEAEDVVMVDAPGSQITVASQPAASPAAKSRRAAESDAMDTSEDGDQITRSDEDDAAGLTKAEITVPSPESHKADRQDASGPHRNGIDDKDTPPATNGYIAIPKPAQATPPTPPQSTDSLGKESVDPLTEGGIPWYLKQFHIVGTSAVEPESAAPTEARSPSEELTDIDDDELTELAIDIEADTITASPTTAPVLGKASTPSKTKVGSSPIRKRTRASARKR